MNDPSFLQILDKYSSSKMREIFIRTCELERKNAADEKKQQAVSAAVEINSFEENIDPKDYPTLHSKHICLKTDKDITAILCDIMKLSKEVKSIDLLKVLNQNDRPTSLVEVPCSANQSPLSISPKNELVLMDRC
jgi:hypothetical protein